MSHPAQMKFVGIVSQHLPDYFSYSNVLEIGSLDINGSVRCFFTNCEYIGIDVGEGPGVDIVCDGQNYKAPVGSFDQVISCEAMEHNPHWIGTFQNMIKLCRPAGLVVMTCASMGRREHGTSRTTPRNSPLTIAFGWEYYKNLSLCDFERQIDLKSNFSTYSFWINWSSYDLYFCGIRNGTIPSRWKQFQNAVDTYLS